MVLYARFPRLTAAAAAGLALASVIVSVAFLQPYVSMQQSAFYLMPTRMWQLLLGVALCHVCNDERWAEWLTVRRALLLEACAVLSLVVSFRFANGHNARFFPVPWALPAVIGASTFILVGATAESLPPLRCGGLALRLPLTNKLLATPPCVYGGKLSYALYLWHWPIFVLLNWTVGFRCALWRTVGLVLTLVASVLSHHGIERPVQRLGRTHPRAVVVAALVSAALLALVLLLLQRGPLAAQLSLAGGGPSTGVQRATGAGDNFASACRLFGPASIPSLSAALGNASGAGISDVYDAAPTDACFSRAAFRAYVDVCPALVPAPPRSGMAARPAGHPCAGRRSLYLHGDSHSLHLAVAMETALLGRYTIRSSSDLPAKRPRACAVPQYLTLNRTEDLKKAHNLAHAMRHTLRPGDVVLHSAYYNRPDEDCLPQIPQSCGARTTDPRRVELHLAQLRILHRAVAAAGASLVLVDDVPRLAYAGRDCAGQSLLTARLGLSAWCEPSCANHAATARASVGLRSYSGRLAALAAELPRTHFLSIHDAFCEAGGGGAPCGPFIPGTAIASYSDTNHIVPEASFSLWPRVRAFFLRRGLL